MSQSLLFTSRQIVFRELPEEVSLAYLISGCELKCPGCHSSDSWDSSRGEVLDRNSLGADLQRFRPWISCVLFMGGEWNLERLCELLVLVHQAELKTALYTGQISVPTDLECHLDYLKTGPYIAKLGGLEWPNTNQKLIRLPSREQICLNQNQIFKEESHGQTK